jgi:hypothetical protein
MQMNAVNLLFDVEGKKAKKKFDPAFNYRKNAQYYCKLLSGFSWKQDKTAYGI